MGACDTVPGISGGTMALITGIYQRFIESIKNNISKNFLLMIKALIVKDTKTFKTLYQKSDIKFLLTLLFGIFTAIFLASKIILSLLENYPAYTLSFFIGLILASSIIIFKEINVHNKNNYISGTFGLVLGLSLIFLIPKTLTVVPLTYVFLGGFLAVSAMFLPGVSGSFVLLVLGLYEIVYNSIHSISENKLLLTTFAAGAILGAIFISRLIDYLFKINKSKTLYFLFGLVIGALIIPIQKVIIQSAQSNNIITATLFLAGFASVLIVEKKFKL